MEKEKNFLDDMPFFVPENNSEEFWLMAGRAEALRAYLKTLALDGARSIYRDKPLSDELTMVAALMGFDDVTAIKREDRT